MNFFEARQKAIECGGKYKYAVSITEHDPKNDSHDMLRVEILYLDCWEVIPPAKPKLQAWLDSNGALRITDRDPHMPGWKRLPDLDPFLRVEE